MSVGLAFQLPHIKHVSMIAKLFITTICHHKQKPNWYMVYFSNSPTNQPPFQHHCHCWPIRIDCEACTQLPSRNFFFFSQRHLMPHFQESAGEGRKHITHSKGVEMAKDHKTIYSTLQDLPIQDLLNHLMRHILWFFPSYWRLVSWQASLFSCHF